MTTPTLHGALADSRFAWLDGVADPLQNAVRSIFDNPFGQQVKNWLNGTPLQHRVHPALVALPIGAWSSALLFDLLDGRSANDDYRTAADITVAFGLIAALPTAAAGLADWVDTYGHQRRVGTAHAVANTLALTLYGSSLVLRGSGQRGTARLLAGLGYAAVSLGGALGGDLAYALGINVSHLLYPKPPNDYVDVLASDDLADGERLVVELERIPVLLLRQNGQIRAVENWCPHVGGPLSEGSIDGDTVTCPWHGSRFCLSDGRAVQGPASVPLRTFSVREEKGRIALRPTDVNSDWPPPPAAPQPGIQRVTPQPGG